MKPHRSPAFREKAANSPAQISAVDTAAPHSAEQSGHLHTIAFVDDEECDRLMVSQTLAKSGKFRPVSLYASAEEALLEIPRMRPQIVLMDIRMPGMSGIECALRLKDVLPGLVVIFVTGLSDAATMIEASQAGGDDFLVKPLDAARCLVTIRFAIARKRSQDIKACKAGLRQIVPLKHRESQVMACIAGGLRNTEIAWELGISVFAVEKISRRIYAKAGVTNRVEATGWFHARV